MEGWKDDNALRNARGSRNGSLGTGYGYESVRKHSNLEVSDIHDRGLEVCSERIEPY